MSEREPGPDRQSGIHIVLADKRPDVRASLEQTLHRSRLGHTLTAFGSVPELLSYLGASPESDGATRQQTPALQPNLIIVGLEDGELDDRHVIEAIKGQRRLRSIPLIALVGRGERGRTRSLYRLGASSVIQLPLHFADLVDIMRVLESYWTETARLPPTPRY